MTKAHGFMSIGVSAFAAGRAGSDSAVVARGRAVLVAALLAWLVPCAAAQRVTDCVAEPDDARRLACYDALLRAEPAPAAPPAAAEAAVAVGAAASAAGAVATAATVLAANPPPTLLSKFWEVDPADKRGTFTVRTYLPNFVLPLHYTSNINRQPTSPTHPTSPRRPYQPAEAELQISLRAKVVEGLLLPDADLWFAYTQRSLWQLWNAADSRPFRSSDYQPEAIYIIPVPARFGTLPGGWRWRVAQLGIAHQSNGQSDPLSRSWNRVYLGGIVERGDFGLQVRANRRFSPSSTDDNPDLTRYIGTTEAVATWLPGLSTAALTWHTDLKSTRRGSLQLDWTYPVNRSQPAGLRWYAQVFTGYGETLIDYNVRQTSVGFGVTLFQF